MLPRPSGREAGIHWECLLKGTRFLSAVIKFDEIRLEGWVSRCKYIINH